MSDKELDFEVAPSKFKLKSTQTFEDRQNAVFGCLQEVLLRHEEAPVAINSECYIVDEDLIGQGKPASSRKRPSSAVFEPSFKRPRLPPTQRRRHQIPDHVKHPEKWTKYSVADTDISERTNTAAAFSFLREMEERKQRAEESKDATFSTIVFKKPKRIQEETPTASSGNTALESTRKHVMAAFEFGKKKEKNRKSKAIEKSSKGNEMNLSHLAEVEDE